MSDEIEKVVTTTGGDSAVNAGGGGLLNADQANRFIDYMWDSTVLLRQARTVRMNSNTLDIDKVGVGERIARLATEAVDDGVNAGANFTKISLTTKKIRLDWEVSTESLEDNIEGADLEDHLARLFATQFGNDLEDLAINGDEDSADPLLKSFDGWAKLTKENGHVLDAAGAGLDRAIFNRALKAMPRKYMQQRPRLRWYVGSNLIQDFLYSETQQSDSFVRPENVAEMVNNGPVRTEGPAGFTTGRSFGVPVVEVPLFDTTQDLSGTGSSDSTDHGDVLLTFPNNLVVGIKREIKIYRKFVEKKDTTEYTVYTRLGVAVENDDAVVVVHNVGVQDN